MHDQHRISSLSPPSARIAAFKHRNPPRRARLGSRVDESRRHGHNDSVHSLSATRFASLPAPDLPPPPPTAELEEPRFLRAQICECHAVILATATPPDLPLEQLMRSSPSFPVEFNKERGGELGQLRGLAIIQQLDCWGRVSNVYSRYGFGAA